MTIFKKIIEKEMPAKIIYEDEDVMIFLDLSQLTFGHSLIIPKEEFESVLTADEQTVAKVNIMAKKLAQSFIDDLGAKGVNILTNANKVAGQTVFHYHVHVIPRYEEDELKLIHRQNSHDLNHVYETLMNNIKSL